MLKTEAAALPVLDGHQQAVVAAGPLGPVPVTEVKSWAILGERTQRSPLLMGKGQKADGQGMSGSIQQLHILRCDSLAPEILKGRVDSEPALRDFLMCKGYTESNVLHRHAQWHDGLAVQKDESLPWML